MLKMSRTSTKDYTITMETRLCNRQWVLSASRWEEFGSEIADLCGMKTT